MWVTARAQHRPYPEKILTAYKTLLCIDFGTRKMGVAVGQSITSTASPLPVIKATNGEPDWPQLEQLVRQWQPDALIIGMPLNMDGTESDMSKLAGKFLRKLAQRFDMPCHTMDERLSTREAREIGRANAEARGKRFDERTEVDSLAAQLILESWFYENGGLRKDT